MGRPALETLALAGPAVPNAAPHAPPGRGAGITAEAAVAGEQGERHLPDWHAEQVGLPLALFVVARFKRRTMFLTAATGMLAVFISMTISFEKLNEAKIHKTANHAASISALFWYFAYTVPYNLGNNALTYSESLHPCFNFQLET